MSILCCIPAYHPDIDYLQIVARELGSRGLDLLIVDNSSSIGDDARFPDNVIIYRPESNKGTAGAYNIAISLVLKDGKFTHLLLIDQDSWIGECYLDFCLTVANLKDEHSIFTAEDKKTITCSVMTEKLIIGDGHKYRLESVRDSKSSGLLIPRNICESYLFNEELFVDYVDWLFCWQVCNDGHKIYKASGIPLMKHALGNSYRTPIGRFRLYFPSRFRRTIQRQSSKYMMKNKHLFKGAPIRRMLAIAVRPIVNTMLDIFESIDLIQEAR